MASVHIGRLLGPVGFARTVAIKRMHPHFAEDPEFVSMFLDEARLAARIRHPNVVPTLDVVATEGELFLVMDYVVGESLSRLVRAAGLRGAPIAPAMVTTLLIGVLHGLHAAHEAKNDHGEALGIVHRDVSPHNVLVGTDGVARVLDFGVAKAAGRIQTTREGQLKGKLAYMAPEHIRGEATRLSDVYAASVVLWEALTGARLFQGTNDAQVLEKVLKGCPGPPGAYVPNLPPALDEITMRGLSVDPAKRYPTARDMARALEALPQAATSAIGDWVEAVAKQSLDERSARIACIESDTSLHAPTQLDGMRPPLTSSASGVSGVRMPSPKSVPPVVGLEEGVPTQLSSGSISRSTRPSFFRKRPRTAWLTLAGGALVLLLAAGTVVSFSRSAATHAPSAITPGPTAGPAAPSNLSVPAMAAPMVFDVTAPSVAPSDSAPPAPLEVASAAADSSARGGAAPGKGPAAGRSRPPAPAAGPGASPPPNCNPPYTFDAQGLKYFKPECFLHH
jgi:serine/threonine-protein kinase